ncbi:MAG: DUF4179 domain-containing protein [Clostridia bacterium]|nr:DUF4179 domain-containing protein [Clostridia bacterium]
MRTAEDFRREMGDGDASFRQCVMQTLATLPEEEPKMKRKASAGLVIAIALLMMTMAALAANWWGIGEFLRNDGADGITVPAGATVETKYATFTVTEYIYDGRGLYIAMAVRPTEEGTLLQYGGDATLLLKEGKVIETTGVTWEEYFTQQGYKQRIWTQIDVSLDGRSMFYTINRANLEKDGTLTLLLFSLFDGQPEDLNLTIDCGAHTKDVFLRGTTWQNKHHIKKGQMQLTLPRNASEEAHWRNAEPLVMNEIGVTLDTVRFITTPLITYFEIDYTAHDPAKNYYFFRFVNEDGTLRKFKSPIEPHMMNEMVDDTTGRGRWVGIITLEDAMPGNVYVKGYQGSINNPDAIQILPMYMVEGR